MHNGVGTIIFLYSTPISKYSKNFCFELYREHIFKQLSIPKNRSGKDFRNLLSGKKHFGYTFKLMIYT
jgi:hypothetical protein